MYTIFCYGNDENNAQKLKALSLVKKKVRAIQKSIKLYFKYKQYVNIAFFAKWQVFYFVIA